MWILYIKIFMYAFLLLSRSLSLSFTPCLPLFCIFRCVFFSFHFSFENCVRWKHILIVNRSIWTLPSNSIGKKVSRVKGFHFWKFVNLIFLRYNLFIFTLFFTSFFAVFRHFCTKFVSDYVFLVPYSCGNLHIEVGTAEWYKFELRLQIRFHTIFNFMCHCSIRITPPYSAYKIEGVICNKFLNL